MRIISLIVMAFLTMSSATAMELSVEPIVVRVSEFDESTLTYTFSCDIPPNAQQAYHWAVRGDSNNLLYESWLPDSTFTYSLPDDAYWHINCGIINGSGEYESYDFHVDLRLGPNTDKPNVDIIDTDGTNVTAECSHPTAENYVNRWYLQRSPQTFELTEFYNEREITTGVPFPGLWSLSCGVWDIDNSEWSQWGHTIEFFPEGPAYVPNRAGCMPWECNQSNETTQNATLTVLKVVVNDDNGTLEIEDFTLYVDGTGVTSGIANEYPPGTYVVSEDPVTGYTGTFSGDCDSGGVVTLSEGENKTCTITNDDTVGQTCYESVEDIPVTCTGGTITQDTGSGCRTIVCGGLQVLACDKPGSQDPQWFEMYKQASAPGVEICLLDTCISGNGYAKSPDYPICTGGPMCTDVDGDGYSIEGGACGPVDCNDANASINPGATEICNGVDDNCDGQIDEGDVCGPLSCPDVTGPSDYNMSETFEIGTASDQLEIREAVGNVIDTVTSLELPLTLREMQLMTSEGSTGAYQYLRFNDYSPALSNMSVNFVENEDDIMHEYLVIPSEPFLEWEIQFPEGLKSEIEPDGALDDLDDVTLNIMGEYFTIARARVDNDGTDFEMVLLSGAVSDTLREGETRTYEIDGVEYEVTLVFVSDPGTNGTVHTKFSVNGELTDLLAEGDMDTLSSGMTIGVRDILVNAREGVASFYLGAKRVEFSDPNVNSSDDFDGSVEIDNENMEDADVDVVGAYFASDIFGITQIKYRVTMDPTTGSTAYVPPGWTVRDYMDDPRTLLSDFVDLAFEGFQDTNSTDMEIRMRTVASYEMRFTNIVGDEYVFPLIANKSAVWKYGDDDDLIFVEGASPVDYIVGEGDYVILNPPVQYSQVTQILRYDGYDSTDFTLTFTEISDGSVIEVPIDLSGGGSLVLFGHAHSVNVSDRGSDSPVLALDLNADGDMDHDVVKIVTSGTIVVDLAYFVDVNSSMLVNSSDGESLSPYVRDGADLEDVGSSDSQRVYMTAVEDNDLFDTSVNGHGKLTWYITEDNPTLNLEFHSYSGPLEGELPGEPGEFQYGESCDEFQDILLGMTDLGTLIREDESIYPSKLTLAIPGSQRIGRVLVIGGGEPPLPVCGNGILEEGEACDDGNNIDGDGCSATCEIEVNETCYETVENIPVTCTGGTITQDTFNGCRTIVCGGLQVLACDKPDHNDPDFFEMYKQASAPGVEICLLDTCISDNGYAKSPDFPICEGGAPVCTDGDADSYAIEGGICGDIDCDDSDASVNPGATEVCNGIDDDCDGLVDEDDVCGPPPPSNESVTLSIAPWFPQGNNVVFHCTPDGFTPNSWSWDFGDGNTQVTNVDNVWHTFPSAGEYTVLCTATDGSIEESDSLNVTL